MQYFIYSRKKNENFLLKSPPLAKTSFTQYTTGSMLLEPNTCFLVRFVIPNSTVIDTNQKELCTQNNTFVFEGIKKLSILNDRRLAFDFTKPLDMVTSDKTDYFMLKAGDDTTHYFIVRAVNSSGIDDGNNIASS